jgi:hypothetical protein
MHKVKHRWDFIVQIRAGIFQNVYKVKETLQLVSKLNQNQALPFLFYVIPEHATPFLDASNSLQQDK